MSITEMYRFNEDAIKSEETQKYMDLVFQQLIDKLSDKINENLEEGIISLAKDLNVYAASKGYTFPKDEAVEDLKKSFPDFREKIHKSIEESTFALQQQLLKEAKK